MSHTMKVECPKCKSGDCFTTVERPSELICASVVTVRVFCNSCTYTKVSLLVNRKELVVETKEPESDDTEIVYTYLGQERG